MEVFVLFGTVRKSKIFNYMLQILGMEVLFVLGNI